MRLVTGQEMREIDRISIQERGIPGFQLMEQAGEAIARVVADEFERATVLCVCGRGNNGGDGLVVARCLHEWDWPVRVALMSPHEAFRGEALLAWQALALTPVPVRICATRGELEAELALSDMVVDALLGTGFSGVPKPPMDWAIEALNASGLPVLAADVPSGLADAGETTGGSPGPVVRAVRTVTLGLPKVALHTETGLRCSGQVSVASLGFPGDLLDSPVLWRHVATPSEMAAMLRPRCISGHKGTFGSALLAGGCTGMTGALMLAAEAALRSGCGLVFLAPPSGLLPIVESRVLEPVKILLPGNAGYLDMEAAQTIAARAKEMNALGLGPGTGRHAETARAIQWLLESVPCPLVLDADGLNALAECASPAEWLGRRTAPTILTPHPGEMARLLHQDVEAVQSHRFEVAREFAVQSGCVIVLKGAGTLVASPGGQVYLNPTGNSGLAKGGSGDVLTGLITGLLAQGYSAPEAARLGVYLHGLAADLALPQSSPWTLLPRDVIASLSAAFRELRKGSADVPPNN